MEEAVALEAVWAVEEALGLEAAWAAEEVGALVEAEVRGRELKPAMVNRKLREGNTPIVSRLKFGQPFAKHVFKGFIVHPEQ